MKDHIRNIFTDDLPDWWGEQILKTNMQKASSGGGQAHTGCAYPPKRPPSGAESNDIIFAI